jgi:hypothetical protein
VNNLCRRLMVRAHTVSDNGGTVYGCAVGNRARCILILPKRNAVTPVAYQGLYRHERAHCNGWRHN